MDQIVHPLPRSRNPGFSGEMKPVAMALGLAFGVGAVPGASAAIITVNNLSGTSVVGQCTLRDALLAAQTNAVVQGCAAGAIAGTDTINFSVTGTISLATDLTVDSNVTINGPGAASLTLAPSSTNRAMTVKSNVTSAISGVTFQGNGTTLVDGAALYHYGGTLTIQNCVFSGNKTTTKGGAIFNYTGTVIVQSSTFTGNQANKGGAIFNYGGNLTVQTSTLTGNQATKGGAVFLYKHSNSATIQQSTFSGNTATISGGAIYLYYSGGITISDSTISGNHATAGSGGAIYFYKAANSTITNSTISGNTAGKSGGAILLYKSILAVNNSTISGNTAVLAGGGFYLTDGGNLASPRLILTSSIVANNTAEVGANDLARSNGTIDATNSLIQNPAGSINGINTANITGVNPMLAPLTNNGGPTQTMALLAGSPAIDKGSNPLALAFDQRGTPFVRSSGVTDIGAFEIQGAPPPPPVANVPVPTLSQWGLALLSAMMAGWAMLTGFRKRRRR
jgi:parallel beta-helix repeat protein/predicted outer membrane repeat protein